MSHLQHKEEGRVYNVGNVPMLRLLRGTAQLSRMASPAEISYDELKSLIEKGQNFLLVDVRSKEEVEKGRIPGSINIHVDSVEQAFALDADAFKATYGVTKPTLDSSGLVFHCMMGGRGGRATSTAQKLGYANARNYKGGYKEWSAKEGQ